MQKIKGDGIVVTYDAEHMEIDGKLVSFNSEYLVNENAQKEGTFLDKDYGQGMFLKNPAEVFAYLLIMENKALLKDPRRSEDVKDRLLSRVNKFIDFPKIFPKEEFHEVVRKIFLQKDVNLYHFFDELEDNIDLSNKGVDNHKEIKNAFLMRLKNVIKIRDRTKAEDIDLQISKLETPPKGFSKTSLITRTIDIFYDQQHNLSGTFPELFDGVRFLEHNWEENLIKNVKEGRIKNDAQNPLNTEDAIDTCHHMKAIRVSVNDLIELLSYNSQKVLKKEAEPKYPKNYFYINPLEYYLE